MSPFSPHVFSVTRVYRHSPEFWLNVKFHKPNFIEIRYEVRVESNTNRQTFQISLLFLECQTKHFCRISALLSKYLHNKLSIS